MFFQKFVARVVSTSTPIVGMIPEKSAPRNLCRMLVLPAPLRRVKAGSTMLRESLRVLIWTVIGIHKFEIRHHKLKQATQRRPALP